STNSGFTSIGGSLFVKNSSCFSRSMYVVTNTNRFWVSLSPHRDVLMPHSKWKMIVMKLRKRTHLSSCTRFANS
ncbi:hypothetical protein PMAYCL1PPCAC_01865, partial [Pristionchus mayeri]